MKRLIVFLVLCQLLGGCRLWWYAPTDKSVLFTNKSSYVISVHTESGDHTEDFTLQIGESHSSAVYGQQWYSDDNPVEPGTLSESWQPGPPTVIGSMLLGTL